MIEKRQMEEIADQYVRCLRTVSDIHQHLPTLLDLSVGCGAIAEVGVRHAVSTWAFLLGLCLDGKPNKQLVCLDLAPPSCVEELRRLSSACGIGFLFYEGDSATTPLPVVDMMFIDTWHIYGHLKRELEFHHSRVRKYIVLHDTEIDKYIGESVRENHDIQQQSLVYGYTLPEIIKGLSFAVDEFLEKHPEWRLKKHYTNNNGLTILEKQG